jgi:mRNA interferase RelE/StbE
LNDDKRFHIKLDPDAVKEYKRLDKSVVGMVNKAIDDLAYRADEVGKLLRNNDDTKLAGCKEKKLREAGVRIVFRVTEEKVEILLIVYILSIEKRSRDMVFKIAHKRNDDIKKLSKAELHKHLLKCKDWFDVNKN